MSKPKDNGRLFFVASQIDQKQTNQSSKTKRILDSRTDSALCLSLDLSPTGRGMDHVFFRYYKRLEYRIIITHIVYIVVCVIGSSAENFKRRHRPDIYRGRQIRTMGPKIFLCRELRLRGEERRKKQHHFRSQY